MYNSLVRLSGYPLQYEVRQQSLNNSYGLELPVHHRFAALVEYYFNDEWLRCAIAKPTMECVDQGEKVEKARKISYISSLVLAIVEILSSQGQNAPTTVSSIQTAPYIWDIKTKLWSRGLP